MGRRSARLKLVEQELVSLRVVDLEYLGCAGHQQISEQTWTVLAESAYPGSYDEISDRRSE